MGVPVERRLPPEHRWGLPDRTVSGHDSGRLLEVAGGRMAIVQDRLLLGHFSRTKAAPHCGQALLTGLFQRMKRQSGYRPHP